MDAERRPAGKTERFWLGGLCAVLCALPTALPAWLLVRENVFTGPAGLLGFLLALGGWRLGAGQFSPAGICLAALLAPAAALPGMYYGCAQLILRDNAVYGCSMEEALELVPTVALDPINRPQLLWALGGVVVLDLLTAALAAQLLRPRPGTKKRKR